MAQATPNYEGHAEFWKPAAATRTEGGVVRPHCGSCGAECVPDSLYCHVCGANRQAAANAGSGLRVPAVVRLTFHAIVSLTSHSVTAVSSRLAVLRDGLGQTNASLAALLAGCFCLVAALVTGLINASTLLDWQAVQLWRIEWLLAAIALMTAGVLLKKQSK